MVSVTRETAIASVAAVPGLAWVVTLLCLGASSLVGGPRLEPRPALTLAEAAALHDEAEILRLVRAGADPNLPVSVRPGVLRSIGYTMTPLEAAIAERRVEILELLVELGAVVDTRNFASLWCFAQTRNDTDVSAFLEARVPQHPAVDCANVKIVW